MIPEKYCVQGHKFWKIILPCYLFSVSNSVCFSSISVDTKHSPISDIIRCRKFGKHVSCTPHTVQKLGFSIDSNGKIETRNPAKGYFGSEFWAICNPCGVMAVWSHDVEIYWWIFVFFFGKMTPYGKIFTILFRNFSLPHRSTLLCSNCAKFCWQEIGEIVRYLQNTKIRLPLKPSLLCRLRPKSARANPQQCAQSALDLIKIGALSAEL